MQHGAIASDPVETPLDNPSRALAGAFAERATGLVENGFSMRAVCQRWISFLADAVYERRTSLNHNKTAPPPGQVQRMSAWTCVVNTHDESLPVTYRTVETQYVKLYRPCTSEGWSLTL